MEKPKERMVEVAIICVAIMYSAAAFNGVNGMMFTAATNAVISLVGIAFGIKALRGGYGEKAKN